MRIGQQRDASVLALIKIKAVAISLAKQPLSPESETSQQVVHENPD